jgi:hypothetical protein
MASNARTRRVPVHADVETDAQTSHFPYQHPIDGKLITAQNRIWLRLPDDLRLDSWCHIGARLHAAADSSAWWIGDWLVFGHDKYPGRYRRAMAETGLDYQTLRNYSWVARSFEPSRRRDTLTFQHHMEVAALLTAEQDHWLDFAVRLGWSRNELRRQVKASTQPTAEHDDASSVKLRLDLSHARYARWLAAAHRDNADLEEWIIAELDRAVLPARM